MKKLLLPIFICSFVVCEGRSQWKDNFFRPPMAFGVHDTCLFGSLQGGHVYRYAPSTPDKWVFADTGINPAYFPITAFGSIGKFLFVDAGYRSTNNGSSWMPMNHLKFIPSCFIAMGGLIFAGGVAGSGVWRSTDSGLNWVAAYSDLPNLNISALAVHNTILFAGTPSGVFRSTDSGNSWKPTTVTSRVDALCVIGSTILAGTGTDGGIHRSTDGGVTWNVSNKGLFKPYVNSIVTDGRNLFAGTGVKSAGPAYYFGSGVFLSRDSGVTWDTVNANLRWLNISTMCVFDTFLIVGAWDDGGVTCYGYIRSIPEMAPPKSGVKSVASIPAPDSLEIFPNPASGFITIRGSYSIARVSVLNVLGAEVLNVPSVRASELTLDLSHFASGTYFLRIETAKGVVMRKVVRE